jgi:hypothetical protein
MQVPWYESAGVMLRAFLSLVLYECKYSNLG